MGTLCMPIPLEGRQAYLDHQMNTCPQGRLVKSIMVGAAYYAAVTFDRPDDAPEPYTIAMICKTSLHGDEFCYKDLTESMGPTHGLQSCPPAILNLLTPIEQLREWGVYTAEMAEWAGEWREACLAHARRPRLKDGDRIRLTRKLRFEGGLEADTFVKTSVPGRRNLFYVDGTGELVRLRLRPRDIRQAARL